ncbi:hypothetical protein L9F63_017289, partial [Diploptera punctata]
MEGVGEADKGGNTSTTTIICNNYLHNHASNKFVVTTDRKASCRSLYKIDDLDLIERAVTSVDDTVPVSDTYRQ